MASPLPPDGVRKDEISTEKRLQSILSSSPGREEDLISLLQRVQGEFGFLSDESMPAVARFLRIPESRVYSVATFYSQFRFTPIGRCHVKVCRGTACHVRGAPRILNVLEKCLGIREGETSADLEYSLETVACIGACGLSPAIMINGKVHARMTPAKIVGLFGGGRGE
jgi:NADH-quinone oxidoreductase subunit E